MEGAKNGLGRLWQEVGFIMAQSKLNEYEAMEAVEGAREGVDEPAGNMAGLG